MPEEKTGYSRNPDYESVTTDQQFTGSRSADIVVHKVGSNIVADGTGSQVDSGVYDSDNAAVIESADAALSEGQHLHIALDTAEMEKEAVISTPGIGFTTSNTRFYPSGDHGCLRFDQNQGGTDGSPVESYIGFLRVLDHNDTTSSTNSPYGVTVENYSASHFEGIYVKGYFNGIHCGNESGECYYGDLYSEDCENRGVHVDGLAPASTFGRVAAIGPVSGNASGNGVEFGATTGNGHVDSILSMRHQNGAVFSGDRIWVGKVLADSPTNNGVWIRADSVTVDTIWAGGVGGDGVRLDQSINRPSVRFIESVDAGSYGLIQNGAVHASFGRVITRGSDNRGIGFFNGGETHIDHLYSAGNTNEDAYGAGADVSITREVVGTTGAWSPGWTGYSTSP
jgi:hypothetical protein